MLHSENENGNIEYKRYFSFNITENRINELITQMNWRLNEGEGIAYYYIGVNDNGTIYDKITDNQIFYSLKILKKMVNNCNSKITNIQKKDRWINVEIKRNFLIKKYKEHSILLLGNSNVGKTTFLSYLVKNKLDNNLNKARNFMFNHKHELESGKTSSITYDYLFTDNDKFIFFDTPGFEEYNKTQLKIILSINYNLVLYFNENTAWKYENLFKNYFKNLQIPLISINTKSKLNNFPNINMNLPPKKDDIILFLKNKLKINNSLDGEEFIVLKTIYLHNIGFIISGYLRKGTLSIEDKMFWYTNKEYNIKIKSIHNSKENICVNTITGPTVATICVDLKKNKFNKYGFISKHQFTILNSIEIVEIYKNKNIIPDTLDLYVDNLKTKIKKMSDKKWYIIHGKIILRNNILNKLCLCLNNEFYGIFKIINVF